ncbi:MAG: hypothetical protein K6A32_09405 [Bacteroidales bacterium]|nr:hypothetical protein [Bacteroidales bacterium]
MMRTIKTIFILALAMAGAGQLAAQDTLWVRYDDRFKANGEITLENVDSIKVTNTQLRLFNPTLALGYRNQSTSTFLPVDAASMMFTNPGRYLLKPNTYSGTNYMNANATSGYNFAHSIETEHYAIFWDVRYGEDPKKIQYPGDGNVANAYTVGNICERCWDKYVELGFVVPGKSTTDNYKIQLYIPYQKEWRADASGTDGVGGGKTGLGHFNPWAAVSRGGGTVAHEVGHTFQYLVHADVAWDHGFDYGYGTNASGGNGWWESCADWQMYKVFPDRQFTDGEYLEGYLPMAHLNFMHEDMRYQNCFFQDWWCQLHGTDFIGRLWRESVRPEDPIEAYMRLCDLTLEQFTEEQFQGCMHMATFDIDAVRTRAATKAGRYLFPSPLKQVSGTSDTWVVNPDYCPQNFGYNVIKMTGASAGTEVKANFKGIIGTAGYRILNKLSAGWRCAFVAWKTNGERVYGDVHATNYENPEATVTFTVPEDVKKVFFVVMGAPTRYWRHPWDDDTSNDEQWPYQVQFENIKPG